MRLSAGTQLGPYKILAPLGAGGMGEVYRAVDTRLGRTVAIKVLPEQIAGGMASRQRMEREARIVAALNHRHICQLFDVGQHEGAEYLVMEYLEGETLAHRLKQGPLPADQALRFAIEIAEALDRAHTSDITHRDLKPGNIMLTKDGVKVLDFGLSKQRDLDPVSPGSDASVAPTETSPLTAEGFAVGTLEYMSPEQLRGAEADARSDIFAFGCVLYEMITRQKAFRAASHADLIVAVLEHHPPSISGLQRGVADVSTRSLERVVARCLAKDPEQRWQSARDLAEELRWISRGTRAEEPQTIGDSRPETDKAKPRRIRPALVVVLVALGAFGAGAFWRGLRAESHASWTGVMLGGPAIALGPRISPDGRMLALQAMVEGLTQVAVMKPETGNWIVLTHARQRGQVTEISWSRDGAKLYFDRIDDVPKGIYSVGVLGGEERLVLEDAGYPEVLPDGSLMVAKINADRQLQIYRVWPDTGRLRAFPAQLRAVSGASMRPFPDGKEVVFLGRPLGDTREDQLYALDLGTGHTRRLAPGLFIPVVNNLFPLAVSPDGQSVLINMPSGNLHRIVAIPRSGGGAVRTLLTVTLIPWYLDAGPDGSLYFEQIEQESEILRFPVSGSPLERVGTSPAFRFGAITELPGGRVLIPAVLGGHSRIMLVEAGREPTPLVETTEETAAPVTSLGPERVAFLIGPPTHREIAIASVADGRILRRLKGPQGEIEGLAGAPDGKTLYYAASKMIWAVPADDGEPKRLTTGDGVVVSPDGRELVVKLNEKGGSRLVRLRVSGGLPEDIGFPGDLRLTTMPLGPDALGKDGRILAPVASSDSWYWHVAILDPSKPQVKRIPVEYQGDLFFAGWGGGGKILALGIGIKGGVWRFQLEESPKP